MRAARSCVTDRHAIVLVGWEGQDGRIDQLLPVVVPIRIRSTALHRSLLNPHAAPPRSFAHEAREIGMRHVRLSEWEGGLSLSFTLTYQHPPAVPDSSIFSRGGGGGSEVVHFSRGSLTGVCFCEREERSAISSRCVCGRLASLGVACCEVLVYGTECYLLAVCAWFMWCFVSCVRCSSPRM